MVTNIEMVCHHVRWLGFTFVATARRSIRYQRNQFMATQIEQATMIEIEIIVNNWKSKQVPTWRAIEKIAAIIHDFQKAEWKREHS